MNKILFMSGEWSESVGDLHTFNRRVINLLTTCRLYLDHVKHNIREMLGNGSNAELKFVNATHEEYDTYLGYRALESLRNYVQHRGFPVHQINLSGRNLEEHGASVGRTIVIPFINTATLRQDGGFKPSVLTELEQMGELVDLRPLVREYIASIGRIHQVLRDEIRGNIGAWEAIIRNAQTEYRKTGASDLTALAAVHENEHGQTVEHVQLFDDFMLRRKALMQKNYSVAHCARHFVSNASHVPL